MKKFLEMYGASPSPPGGGFIVAAGVFDGVHRGHAEIIRAASAAAEETGARVMALTFHPHPRALLSPGSAPALLVPEEERVRLLRAAGAHGCCFINFTAECAGLPPEEFLRRLRGNGLFSVSGICVGSRWRFGAGGAGGAGVLKKFCGENGWLFRPVDELTCGGVTISSSAIRAAAAAGDLERAAAMLGRDLRLYGTVERGFGIAGPRLSAPTANLKLAAGVLPPDGVYCGSASAEGGTYPAVVNIGVAPTFAEAGTRRIEVHLLDFSGSLYGASMSVALRRFLRPERKFASPEDLKRQIALDISEARR